jgi:hypothetical protein
MTQKVKLSPETITVLQNLAGINKSLLFRKGSTLYTVSEVKSVMAKATIAESFESDFAIYDVKRLLAVISHFSDPELVIGDKFITIQEGKRKLNYTFADPRHIQTIDEATFNKLSALTDNADISFDWKHDVYTDVNKARTIMNLPEFQVVGDGEDVKLRAIDTDNPTSDVYDSVISEGTSVFTATFKSENIKFLPLDYQVKISPKGIARFASENTTYLVTTEAKKK